MFWLVLAAAVVASALVVMGVGLASRRLAAQREHDDRPNVRSAVTFALRREQGALPTLLDAIHAQLDAVGADASSFAARGAGFELDGVLGEVSFRVSLAPIALDEEEALPSISERFLLLLHARTLGRYRYVAPPDTPTTRTLLSAIDATLRTSDDVGEVTWQSRQDVGADASGA